MSKVFDCLYGGPNTAKSESAARLIEHVFTTTRKRSRVVLGDGSGLTYQHLVDAGIVDMCEFGTRPWPQDTMQKLSDGWWPNAENVLVKTDPAVLETFGVCVFEGLSVAGAYIMGNVKGGLAERSGRGEKIGQDSPIRIVEGDVNPANGQVVSGTGPGTTFGGNPPSHYNVAQRTLLECLQRSKALPIDYVLWTAHEADNNPEKDINKESLVGPESVGKAMTGSIQRNFNNTLHFVTVAKKVKVVDTHTGKPVDSMDLEYRLHTRDHFSATGSTQVRYKACTRGGDDSLPAYIVAKKPGEGLLDYYTQLATMRTARTASLMAAPGLSV